MRANNIKLVTGSFLIIAFASFIGSTAAGFDQMDRMQVAGSTPFEVRKGDGVSEIAKRLSDEKIIGSRFSFLTYAAMTGAFKNLKPGLYALPVGNVPGIVRALTKGPQEISVTLAPGMSVGEMDKKLYESGVIRRHELEALSPNGELEGYLMPDTYNFHQQSDAQRVADKMQKNFKDKTADLFKNIPQKDISRIVIIASLIEKEVPHAQDRKIVSGIIQKRLSDSYPLQIDASVAYGACKGIFSSCETFNSESFKQDTPYNTYLHTGLPPHPIANPSVDAIDAALHPTQTDYYFYLSDRATGETHFSETFEQHTANRSKYLR